ncbi:phage minor head protein [Priestia aryabhattai]|uniref:Phage minor head protein n=1 Tax=Priestia aryabhattai TaxID=412384 RepID=A0ABD7X2H1_PRIAR|nr:phage minor head protein [Priestia aryabhattai]WEA46820.1 phage minor head protein [Priestia aryabhattai]
MSKMKKRFKAINKLLDGMTTAKEKVIIGLYKKCFNEMYALLHKQYKQYQTDGILTFETMIKQNRLKKFETKMIQLLTMLNKDVGSTIYEHLQNVRLQGYYRSSWIIETMSKVKLGYRTVPTDVLEKSIEHNFTGLTLNDRLEKQRKEIIIRLRETVTRGLNEGQSIQKMSRAVQKDMGVSAGKANRIVRTESHRLIQQSTLESANHANKSGVIMVKEWNSSKDERVRQKHKANHRILNGKKIFVHEKFKQGSVKGDGCGMMGTASHDINCRCILSYEIERIEAKTHEELAKLTYEEWMKLRLAP